jgi:hypothetical protein
MNEQNEQDVVTGIDRHLRQLLAKMNTALAEHNIQTDFSIALKDGVYTIQTRYTRAIEPVQLNGG